MPLAVNDIVQTTVIGRKDGQNILNVFHYRCSTAPSTGTPAENLSSLIVFLWEVDTGYLEPAWLECLPNDYTLNAVRAQVVAPVRGAYVERLIVDDGDIDTNVLNTPNLTWVFVKQAELAGRRGRGTTHMVVPTTDWISNGELAASGGASRDALVALMDDQITVPAGGVFEPVIYHPGFSPSFSRITHCTIKQEIRTMSRRTVGRGI